MDNWTLASFSSMKFSLTFRDKEFDPDSGPDSDFESDFETFLNSFTVVKATGRIRDQYPRYSISG